MLVLGKGIFGNVRMLFLLYARIGVINFAKCYDINRRATSVPIKKPKKRYVYNMINQVLGCASTMR